MSTPSINGTSRTIGRLYAGMTKESIRADINAMTFPSEAEREKAYNKQIKLFDYANSLVEGEVDDVISQKEIEAYNKKEKTKQTWKTIGLAAAGIGMTVASFLATKKIRKGFSPKVYRKEDCNITRLKDDNVSDIVNRNFGQRIKYRIATSGYSLNLEGYEEPTKAFLDSMDKTLGRSKTAYIMPSALEKGSIYDITVQVSGLGKKNALFVTAEEYYNDFLKLENFADRVDMKKYMKTPMLVFPTPEVYTSATANASNVLVATGGRTVAVNEIIEAIKRKHKVVLLHNLNLKNGVYNGSNEVENAARYFEELRLAKALECSDSKRQELQALLDDPDTINKLVRIYLVNDAKSAAEAGKRAAKFIQSTKSAAASSQVLPSIDKVKTMTETELRELAEVPGGINLMKKAGVVNGKTKQTVIESAYGSMKHEQIRTSDGQVISSSLVGAMPDGKTTDLFKDIPREILQTQATEHIHPISWSTINPEVGVTVTQNPSTWITARKVVTDGTLENSLVVNNSHNIPLRYDVITGSQYIETPLGRQALTGEGFMAIYSRSDKAQIKKSNLTEPKFGIVKTSKTAANPVSYSAEDRSFVPADIAEQQYEMVTKSGEVIPCDFRKTVAGVDYRFRKRAIDLKMAVPPTEVVSSEGEILAARRLYMVNKNGNFYDANPVELIKRGKISLNFDMSDPVQAQIKNAIDESLRLETKAESAKKAGNKGLFDELSRQAEQYTKMAEQKLTAWVESIQNKNNANFYRQAS